MISPHNLYLHVPFCASKCNYCAFYSHACKNPDWDRYSKEILQQITRWREIVGLIEIPTVFFGGGTPSLMPAIIFEKIMNSIRKNFQLKPQAEITLESNPGTIDKKKLGDFKSTGMNRISIGVQSLDDSELRFLGRTHNVATALNLIDSAHNIGLRVSADFIYGLPKQSSDDIKSLCKKINDIGLTHCSMYELSIESGTHFDNINLETPDDEIKSEMYEAIEHTLLLPRYEVSNYSVKGDECQHNQNIWNGMPYIGLGTGAVGRPFIKGVWYEQNGNNKEITPLDIKTRAIEKIILGLRTTRGIELTPDICSVINLDFIKDNSDLFESDSKNKIVVTKKGLLILDNLLLRLIAS